MGPLFYLSERENMKRVKEAILISLLFIPSVLNKLLYMLGIMLLIIILVVLFGLEVPTAENGEQEFNNIVLKFNDFNRTEIYVTDIRSIKKQLVLSKGYVIDITTYTTAEGERVQTLRYIRQSERNKDFEALIYKFDEYGIKYKNQIKFD